MRSSWKLLIAFLSVAAVSAAVGFFGSQYIRSPADVAAQASPPPLTDLTAKVEIGHITDTVILQGTVNAGKVAEIAPAAPANGDAAIVTSMPLAVGDPVEPGQVVVAIADRPVIVLPGDIPLLRSMSVGANGADVKRLQDALRASGLDVSDPEGYFGWETRRAIRQLYDRAGYSAPPAGQPLVSTSEIAIVSGSFPARVVELGVRVGSPTSDNPVVTLATSPPEVDASANPNAAQKIVPGMSAVITSTESGEVIESAVQAIGPVEQTEDAGFQASVTIEPVKMLPESLIGATVQISINTAQDAEEGLIVPISAIYSGSDGTTYVDIVEASGQKVRQKVSVVRTGDGMAQVTGDGLQEGASVSIGISG